MREIEWHPNYELGFEDIDRDHRRVFEIANAMMRALDRRRLVDCKRLAADFIDALELHFEREEAFLRRIAYPETDAHARYHEGLLVNAEKFMTLCESAEEGDDVRKPFADLVSVLLADIRGGDLEFRSFLLEKGLDTAMDEMGLRRLWI